MCRWIAYAGAPVYLEELLFKPKHSLIDQSLAACAGETTTNGDGFGVGWYGNGQAPGLYKGIQPAWSDENLLDLASQIKSPMFMAHVRSTTGTAIQRTNCHPFRHGRWLFQHNGAISDFPEVKRDLVLAISPRLFPEVSGSTDSEVMFFLALTFGLEDDPIVGVERSELVHQDGRNTAWAAPRMIWRSGWRPLCFRYSAKAGQNALLQREHPRGYRQHFRDVHAFSAMHRRGLEPLGELKRQPVWIGFPNRRRGDRGGNVSVAR